MKPTRVPMLISPESTRRPPIHSTMPIAAVTIAVIVGKNSANPVMTLMRRTRKTSFSLSKRSISCGSRAKALTTRAPVKFSWARVLITPS